MTEHPGGLPPNRFRITLALDAAELYGPEVDIALGGREPMVDRWELGELEPTPEQIIALARLTRMPPAYFYLGDPPMTPGWVCGRRKVDGRRCRPIDGQVVSPAAEARERAAARKGVAPPAPPAGTQAALF